MVAEQQGARSNWTIEVLRDWGIPIPVESMEDVEEVPMEGIDDFQNTRTW